MRIVLHHSSLLDLYNVQCTYINANIMTISDTHCSETKRKIVRQKLFFCNPLQHENNKNSAANKFISLLYFDWAIVVISLAQCNPLTTIRMRHIFLLLLLVNFRVRFFLSLSLIIFWHGPQMKDQSRTSVCVQNNCQIIIHLPLFARAFIFIRSDNFDAKINPLRNYIWTCSDSAMGKQTISKILSLLFIYMVFLR